MGTLYPKHPTQGQEARELLVPAPGVKTSSSSRERSIQATSDLPRKTGDLPRPRAGGVRTGESQGSLCWKARAQPACKAAVYKLQGGLRNGGGAWTSNLLLGRKVPQATGKVDSRRGRRGGKANRTQHCHCFRVPIGFTPNRDIRKHGAEGLWGSRGAGRCASALMWARPVGNSFSLQRFYLTGARDSPRRQDGASLPLRQHHWWADTSGERRHKQGRRGPLGWRRVSRN